MNREEFSALMVASREEAGLSMNEVMRRMGCTFLQVQRMEKSENNFSIDNVFKYLDAIGFVMTLTSSKFKDKFKLHSRQDFKVAFPKIRKLNGLSQIAVAQAIGVSRQLIMGIENKDLNTSIDKFLQCIYGLGYEIKINKK